MVVLKNMIGVVEQLISATVTTDSPYYVVQWYLDECIYQGSTPGGYEGDEDGPTTATFTFSAVSVVRFKENNYTIKAIAWDQENHE